MNFKKTIDKKRDGFLDFQNVGSVACSTFNLIGNENACLTLYRALRRTLPNRIQGHGRDNRLIRIEDRKAWRDLLQVMQQIGSRTIIWAESPNSSLRKHSVTCPASYVSHCSSLVKTSITSVDGQTTYSEQTTQKCNQESISAQKKCEIY